MKEFIINNRVLTIVLPTEIFSKKVSLELVGLYVFLKSNYGNSLSILEISRKLGVSEEAINKMIGELVSASLINLDNGVFIVS
jgi:DNA-binding IscR family transcriptional regulator